MAGKGGKRPGAGRKKGFRNKVNAEIKARLAESGRTPLEVLTRVMNTLLDAAERIDILNKNKQIDEKKVREQLSLLERAADIASKAAPYTHARLQSVEHKGEGGGPVKHDMTLSVEESYLRMVRGS